MNEEIVNRPCSVRRSLEVLGDRWTFLILREAFFGVRYYDQFLSNLGIATNILSVRLKGLVANGILDKQRDPDDARRVTYQLTEKGLDLYPVTLALMKWGDDWLADEDGPPLSLHHKECDQEFTAVLSCSQCGEPVKAQEVRYEVRPSGRCADLPPRAAN